MNALIDCPNCGFVIENKTASYENFTSIYGTCVNCMAPYVITTNGIISFFLESEEEDD